MRELRRIGYDVTTLWRFDAPIDAVWDAIADAERWPEWWPGVEHVVTVAPGGPGGLGAERRMTCRGVLPFRLTILTRVTRIEPPVLLEGRVDGELVGLGRCRLSHEDGWTAVRYDWQVRTTRAWMNLAGRLASPVFRWNHQAMMRAGGRGLAQRLAGGSRARTLSP